MLRIRHQLLSLLPLPWNQYHQHLNRSMLFLAGNTNSMPSMLSPLSTPIACFLFWTPKTPHSLNPGTKRHTAFMMKCESTSLTRLTQLLLTLKLSSSRYGWWLMYPLKRTPLLFQWVALDNFIIQCTYACVSLEYLWGSFKHTCSYRGQWP